jgi:hypothetical protein
VILTECVIALGMARFRRVKSSQSCVAFGHKTVSALGLGDQLARNRARPASGD